MSDLAQMKQSYAGRKVLVTGHTGFKGSWLSMWLHELGASVCGYSLPPHTTPSLFVRAGVEDIATTILADIRDRKRFEQAWADFDPDIVFHLAAQSLVRESYREPIATLETNVIGTAHALDIARESRKPLAMVVVTSDKCYHNREWHYGYRENDRLGGHDVYSMSKAAAELLVDTYRKSFFEAGNERGVSVATARAGNVIGGGDWSLDRLVPDCIRALESGTPVDVRNAESVRPWQHVLEPLSGYLELGARLLSDDEAVRRGAASAWNFGPAPENTRTVGDLVKGVIEQWGEGEARDAHDASAVHEAGLLKLSIDKAYAELGWKPRWDFRKTLERTVTWYKYARSGENMMKMCIEQIREYSAGGE